MPNETSSTVGNELRFSRLLDAPIRLVWEVWADPEHIKKWWGPAGFRNTIRKMDLTPGGEWILVMHGPDGRDYDIKCIFHEIVKYERIVYEQFTPFRYVARIEFDSRHKKTFILWTMLFESKEYLIQTAKLFGVEAGFQQNTERLVDYLLHIGH